LLGFVTMCNAHMWTLVMIDGKYCKW
jgi:hypothetical protein